MESLLSISDCRPENIKILEPIKRILEPRYDIHYHSMPFRYEYPDTFAEEFVIQGCEMMSTSGIMTMTLNNGEMSKDKHKHKIYATPVGKEAEEFLFFTDVIENMCIDALNKHKTALKFGTVDISHFPKIVKYVTKLKRSMSINLTKDEPGFEDTIFTDHYENVIPWELLRHVRMKFIPVLQFNRINITSGQFTVCVNMIRAVITDIQAPQMRYKQNSIINKLNNEHPGMSSRVFEQLQEIKNLKVREQTKRLDDVCSEEARPEIFEDRMSVPGPIDIPLSYGHTDAICRKFVFDTIQEVYLANGQKDVTVSLTMTDIFDQFKIWHRKAFPGVKVPYLGVLKAEISSRWGKRVNGRWSGIRFISSSQTTREIKEKARRLEDEISVPVLSDKLISYRRDADVCKQSALDPVLKDDMERVRRNLLDLNCSVSHNNREYLNKIQSITSNPILRDDKERLRRSLLDLDNSDSDTE